MSLYLAIFSRRSRRSRVVRSTGEYRLRYGAVLVSLFGRTTAKMHENYCFKCGSYTRIDDLTKLCRACYGYWPEAERPGR